MKSHNTSDGRQMESLLDRARVHPERSMVMLNLNRYKADVEFPHGGQYSNYMAAITHSVKANGGAVLWRADVQGSVVGGLEGFHEVPCGVVSELRGVYEFARCRWGEGNVSVSEDLR